MCGGDSFDGATLKTKTAIRVCIVDDQADLRFLVRGLLDEEPDILVVGEAADGEEALDVIDRCRPDVVLLDVRMPRRSGLEVLAELDRRGAVPKTILFTSDSDISVAEAVRAGAQEVVHKTKNLRRISEKIRAVALGQKLSD